MVLVLYVLLKLLAYTVWSAFGIELLCPSESATNAVLNAPVENNLQRKWLSAIGYGFLRLVMGVFFGALIWILGSAVAQVLVAAPHHDVFTYLLVYVPVRWVEWTILAWFIARRTQRISLSFSWKDISARWRLGGIAISCLADIPVIALADWMLPVGRFLC